MACYKVGAFGYGSIHIATNNANGLLIARQEYRKSLGVVVLDTLLCSFFSSLVVFAGIKIVIVMRSELMEITAHHGVLFC